MRTLRLVVNQNDDLFATWSLGADVRMVSSANVSDVECNGSEVLAASMTSPHNHRVKPAAVSRRRRHGRQLGRVDR